MKKQSIITSILCVLLAAVVVLSIAGVKAQDGGSFAGQTFRDSGVSSPVSMKPMNVTMDYAFPTIPE